MVETETVLVDVYVIVEAVTMHEHAELISVDTKFCSCVGKPRFTLAALYVYSVYVAPVTVVPL